MKRSTAIALVLSLILPLILLAAQYNQTLNPGDSIVVSGSGSGVLQVVQNGNNATINFVAFTPTPAVSSTPVPTAVASNPQIGIWLSRSEVMALPMTGTAWDNLKAKAQSSWGSANLQDLNSTHDVLTLAGALYYVRTGDTAMRVKVANAIMSAPETENGGRTLEPSRNIVSYVIAADLINLGAYDATKNNSFKTWLTNVRYEVLDSKTIVSTHNDRPNNWGTHAGSTRVAIDRYIGDSVDLAIAAIVVRGWLGERSTYAGFKYSALDWQSSPTTPRAINPVGATIQGHNVDGVLPDDQRRGGTFTWPPFKENYAWEAMQGASVQAQLLNRAGYDTWNWSDQAMLRATTWLYVTDSYPAEGDDVFIPWIINKAYGTHFTTVSPVGIGKNMSYTDWTHR